EWGADYWWQNVRQTVRFTDAVDKLVAINQLVFVELSPHPVLGSAITECLAKGGHKGKVLLSLRRLEAERATLLRSLGALWTIGRAVAWDKVAPAGGRMIALPTYPWQREHHWHESEEGRQLRLPTLAHPLLGWPLNTPLPS